MRTITCAAVSIILTLGGARAAGADTISVPENGDIQAAVACAKSGDTILLAGGATYNIAAGITVDAGKKLRFRSNPFNPARICGTETETALSFSGSLESPVEIDVQFIRFENLAAGIVARGVPGIDGANVKLCSFVNVERAIQLANNTGTVVTTSTAIVDVNLTLNSFQQCEKAVWVWGYFQRVSVRYNAFDDCWQAITMQGVTPQGVAPPQYSSSVDIDHNVLVNPTTMWDNDGVNFDPLHARGKTASIGVWPHNILGLRVCANVIDGYDSRRPTANYVPGHGIELIWSFAWAGTLALDATICHNYFGNCMLGISSRTQAGTAANPILINVSGLTIEANRFDRCWIGYVAAWGSNHVDVRNNSYCRSRICDILLIEPYVDTTPADGFDDNDPDGFPVMVPDPVTGVTNLSTGTEFNKPGDFFMPPFFAKPASDITIHERADTVVIPENGGGGGTITDNGAPDTCFGD